LILQGTNVSEKKENNYKIYMGKRYEKDGVFFKKKTTKKTKNKTKKNSKK